MALEIHLEAVIERVWRWTWRPRLSELRDALGGRVGASLEMYLETERLSELSDALGGRDQANSEMRLEAVIEQ